MKDLKLIFEELGFTDVQTYIQSGNCAFDACDRSTDGIPDQISDAINKKFGFRPQIIVISKDELTATLDENPYMESEADPKILQLYFLSEPAKNANWEEIERLKSSSERCTLTDRVFYLYAPYGIGRSKLAAQAEKKLGVSATARNFRTAQKLTEMLR